MLCSKCGAILDDDAVFCDSCGSFVMREEKVDPAMAEVAGKRKRKHSFFWLYFKPVAVIIIVAAGIAAAIIGYNWIENQDKHKNKAPEVSDRLVWGEAWTHYRWLPR